MTNKLKTTDIEREVKLLEKKITSLKLKRETLRNTKQDKLIKELVNFVNNNKNKVFIKKSKGLNYFYILKKIKKGNVKLHNLNCISLTLKCTFLSLYKKSLDFYKDRQIFNPLDFYDDIKKDKIQRISYQQMGEIINKNKFYTFNIDYFKQYAGIKK